MINRKQKGRKKKERRESGANWRHRQRNATLTQRNWTNNSIGSNKRRPGPTAINNLLLESNRESTPERIHQESIKNPPKICQ